MTYGYRTSFTAAAQADREETIVDGRFSSSGDIALADGTATQGAIYFADDKNTGIYSPSNDQIAFTTAGTAALTIANNNATFAGNVSTGETLTITGANPNITFVDSDNDPDYKIYASNAVLTVLDSTAGENALVLSKDSATFLGNATFGGDVTSNNIYGRNLIQNGDMSIYQRSSSEKNNLLSNSAIKPNILTADRWGGWAAAADKYKTQVVTDASSGIYRPSDFKYSTKITSLAATSMSSSGYYTLSQRIEKANIQHLKWRTSDAQKLILSFWVKSSVTGTFSTYLMFKHASGQAACPNNYTISSADTWEKKTITFPGYTETSQSDETNDSVWGLEFGFTLGAGTSYHSTANQWTTTQWKIGVTGADDFLSNNAATIQFTGVQLEIGNVATPFEQKSCADNLRECQRYYQNSYLKGNSPTSSTSNDNAINLLSWADGNIQGFTFIGRMRAAPTVTLRSPASTTAGKIRASDGADKTASATNVNDHHVKHISVTSGVASSWNEVCYEMDAEL